MEFVLPVRLGGLGNQMFQVAAALVYTKECHKQILLPDEHTNVHNHSGQNYADTIFRAIPCRVHRPIDTSAFFILLQNGFTRFPGDPGYQDWQPLPIPGNVVLNGYFQSWKALRPHEEMIRSFYQESLAMFLEPHETPLTQCVGIHIRRGDYLKPPHCDVHINLGLEYYSNALQELQKKSSQITQYHIFSDDIEWCQEQELFTTLPNVVFIDEPNECRGLARMTRCQGGFICANSTFSWWGAFLGAYAQKAPIVAPRLWTKGQEVRLCPEDWILL